MMFWIALLAIASLIVAAIVWLALTLYYTRKDCAAIFEIHTRKLREYDFQLKSLRETSIGFPRYVDAAIALPLSEQECETPEWTAHDDRVSYALGQAVPGPNSAEKVAQNAMQSAAGWVPQEMGTRGGSGGGVAMRDPDSAPFFTESAPEK